MPDAILVVDDDPQVRTLLQAALKQGGYQVLSASNGQEALRLFGEHQPDLVILDVVMEEMSGWEVCAQIRQVSTVPVVFLTGSQGANSEVSGLDLGADDYILKPVRIPELLARVRAVLRRARTPALSKVQLVKRGDLTLDTTNRIVTLEGAPITLTRTEYELLLYLVRNAGQTLTTQQIYDEIWSMDSNALMTSVKWYIWRLRRKIEPDPRNPRFILTVPGVGYRFSTHLG